jgi:hypothetical protein
VAGKTFANGLQLSGFIEMLAGTKVTPISATTWSRCSRSSPALRRPAR